MADSSSWEEAKQQVRAAADIVQVIGEHVQLRRAGGNFLGLCPFHSEKTASFSVNPQWQSYKCFGCGESGDVFAFLMQYQNLSFPEALRELAGRYHITLPEPKLNAQEREQQRLRELLWQINTEAAKIYNTYLGQAPQAERARSYLRQRGVPEKFIAHYHLGYAPAQWDFLVSGLRRTFPLEKIAQAGLIAANHRGGYYDRFRDRLLFPIYDQRGRVTAFGGRVLGDEQPKYMNSPESLIFRKSKILFGLWQHRKAIRRSRRAVLVEGNFDLLLLSVHGISNTVAPLGTSLTCEHLRSLRSCCQEVVLLFDGDAAGLKAARRAVPLFLAEQMEAEAALLPAGHDPDSFVREHGAAALHKLLAAAQPLPEFVFAALVEEHGLTLSGKNRIMAELITLIKQSPQRRQQELMAAHFAGKLEVSPHLFLEDTLSPQTEPVAASLPPAPPAEKYSEPCSVASPAPKLAGKEQQLLEFLIFYPEYFNDLRQGGLDKYAARCSPLLRAVIDAMQRLAEQGDFQPEQLLAVLSKSAEKQQVADILLLGAQNVPEHEEQAQECCQYLLNWLALQEQLHLRQEAKGQDAIAALQKKIFTIRQRCAAF